MKLQAAGALQCIVGSSPSSSMSFDRSLLSRWACAERTVGMHRDRENTSTSLQGDKVKSGEFDSTVGDRRPGCALWPSLEGLQGLGSVCKHSQVLQASPGS